MLTLVMNPGLPEEQIFPVPRGSPVTIGRTKDNAIFCLHKSLSRKHAQLEFDGGRVRITDLQSKNGVFHKGKRVQRCELGEGESFRCGDITFLVEGSTIRSPRQVATAVSPGNDRMAQTLPSPLALDASASKRPTHHPPGPKVTAIDDERYKDRLYLLIRASELCVSAQSIDRLLDDLVALVVQVLEVDRIALLTLDNNTLEMRPRVVKSFAGGGVYPYSHRIVDWIVDHGSPASWADVARDRTLPGDPTKDAGIRGAMGVPINPGGGTIGVIYVDSLSRPDCFRPDDLALLRALANLAAVSIESAALRGGTGLSVVPSPRR